MPTFDFDSAFEFLTGNQPLSWQRRLYKQHFEQGELDSCSVIDIPTGLGKTMVMAIWLIARARHPEKVPTRFICVVDRRTVVDQATDISEEFAYLLAPEGSKKYRNIAEPKPKLAERKRKFADTLDGLRQGLGIAEAELAISTLRGQLADNREWSRDPSRPAIIIGTVDLIGSALLFSGYRSSYKRRPLEAGLLGQDSLLVLDEAHLSKPFAKLLGAIEQFSQSRDREGAAASVKPMRVICMSATSGKSADSKPPFTLQFDNGSLAGEDAKDETIAKRFGAKKRLTIATLGEKEKLIDRLAGEAIKLAEDNSLRGKRIVVFVRKPDDARDIAERIRNHGKPTKSKSNPDPKGLYAEAVEVLTGTMRGLERDELVDKPVLQRFLDGDENPDFDDNTKPVFLVATSAGEVGFDANADHLCGDAGPLDSWTQRLGRVNRRGNGDATIILVRENNPADKTDFDKACVATSKLLQDGMDVSPKALAALKKSLSPQQIDEASSPKPTMEELTEILLDAWSMTSITERMPGRPEVGPWLRGIDETQAQTTVAWRAEIELFGGDPTPERALSAIFIKHSIRPHESLTINTGYLLEFLKRLAKLKDRPLNLTLTRVAVRLPRGQVVCRTLEQLIDEPSILYADSTLILPSIFGGLDNAGMLDAESIPKAREAADPDPPSRDVADHPGYEQTEALRSRLRIVIKRSEDASWTPKPLPGGFPIPEDVKLESFYDKSTELFDDLKAAGLRVRLVQPIRFDDEGDPAESLVILAPAPAKKSKEDQLLTDHVRAVEDQAKRIADSLGLAASDPIRIALLFAAKWHDQGKKARIWQLFANNPDPNATPLGKIAQSRDPKSLRGYRHEFGSLLRIHHADRHGATGCDLPTVPEARELALHLIATHHGASRPHFGPGQYHLFSPAEVDGMHTNSIRRFAQLQRKYGWWRLAWLENLLRCADALASADQDSEDDPVDTEGEKP